MSFDSPLPPSSTTLCQSSFNSVCVFLSEAGHRHRVCVAPHVFSLLSFCPPSLRPPSLRPPLSDRRLLSPHESSSLLCQVVFDGRQRDPSLGVPGLSSSFCVFKTASVSF